MVRFIGFTGQERRLIGASIKRLGDDDYRLCELRRIEKADLPGYAGKVVPRHAECGERWDMTMYLASCDPFTVAHELAHVSDIAVRRGESRDHLALRMPTHWHVAHTMSAEYYANRVACGYAGDDAIASAFRSDAAGLAKAARDQDWASCLTYYSLMLGILHAKDRPDGEPLHALAGLDALPEAVTRGMAAFRRQSMDFFASYRQATPLAA